jgi:hypothetical protein
LIVDGFEIAKDVVMTVLADMRCPGEVDKAVLMNVARTSLRTKLAQKMADHLTEVGV